MAPNLGERAWPGLALTSATIVADDLPGSTRAAGVFALTTNEHESEGHVAVVRVYGENACVGLAAGAGKERSSVLLVARNLKGEGQHAISAPFAPQSSLLR